MKKIAIILSIAGLLLTLTGCNSKPYTTKTQIPVNNLYTSTMTETEINVGFKTDIKGKYKYYSLSTNDFFENADEIEVTDAEFILTKSGVVKTQERYKFIRISENKGFVYMYSVYDLVIFDEDYMIILKHNSGYELYKKVNE